MCNVDYYVVKYTWPYLGDFDCSAETSPDLHLTPICT